MKVGKRFSATATVFSLALGLMGPMVVLAAGPAAINLGTAGNFVILAKTGISTTGNTSVVGDIGVSPAAASYITGFALSLPSYSAFSTAAQITGKAYASDYASPTPANLTTAVLDMQAAYIDGAGRSNPTATEMGGGAIGGLTITPGLYKWSTGVTVTSDVVLSGSASDVWIFQIGQNLNFSSGVKVILSGGATASNVFWVVAGQTTIGTTAVVNGSILDQTAIVLNTGATLTGRALAQTAVTLDASTVTTPGSVVVAPVIATVPAVPATPAVPTVNSAVPATPAVPRACFQDAAQCSDGSYVMRTGPSCEFSGCPLVAIPPMSQPLPVSYNPAPATVFGQEVRMIAASLRVGAHGNNVETLQGFLISQNKGPAARALAKVGATSHFGRLTRSALAEFQAKVGIRPAIGNFGPITRAYLNATY